MFIVTNLFLLLQFVSALHGNSEFAGDVAYGLLQTVYALNPNRVSKLKPYFDLGRANVTNHTIPAVTKHNLTLPKLNSVAAKVKNKIRVEEMTTLTTKKIDIRTKIPTTTSPSEDLDEHVTISEATTRRTTKDMLNCEGEWSDWSNMGKCSEECGSCGVIQRFRTCLSYKNGTGCPCSGQYKTIRACNVKPCKFPKPSCCPPYDLMYKHEQFWCGPQDEDIIEDALKDSA
ncbi:unnamed protein product [Bursaphelenchus okinawaensis]|uniref:Uncharacterized protein n=1 Tax=Bursaphelenchus okinawaensis TaxID=465554 RepID=A0A811JUE1_9BILA|nr:unnamed protein product [Bursaphelenchus okinawaensis]CAG9083690.1 unnamed protein product [Bursaphelenchus okinawaensis]